MPPKFGHQPLNLLIFCHEEVPVYGIRQLLDEVTGERNNYAVYQSQDDPAQGFDACIISGSNWFGVPVAPVAEPLRASGIPVLYLGITRMDHDGLTLADLTDSDRGLLSRARLVTVPDRQTGKLLASYSPRLLPCPSIFSSGRPPAPRPPPAASESIRVGLVAGPLARPDHYDIQLFTMLQQAFACELIRHDVEGLAVPPGDPGVAVRYSHDIRDYFDIYDRYDLVVTSSVDAAGIAASLGIPAFVISDTLAGADDADTLPLEHLRPGRDSVAAAFERIRSFDTADRSRQILAHRFLAREQYGPLIRSALADLVAEPDRDEVLKEMAQALNTGDFQAAIICADRLLDVDARQAGALHGKAHALFHMGQLSSASRVIDRALAVASRSEAVVLLATEIYLKLGQPKQVRAICEQAIRAGVGSGKVLHQLGFAHLKLGQFDPALSRIDQALTLSPQVPEIHFSRALTLLSAGRLQEGLQQYEWRWRMKRFEQELRTDRPRWDGEPLRGKRLLISGEQGFGDRIQFIRFAALLAQPDVELIYHCPSALRGVFERIPALSEVTRDGTVPSDYWVPLLSLPLLTGLRTLDEVPGGPYLEPGPRHSPLRVWARGLSGLKVGLAWQSRQTDPAADAEDPSKSAKSIPIDLLQHRLSPAGITLIALDPNASSMACEQLGAERPGPPCQTFADTADVIAEMDLVVSIDTATAHLAGALGKTVWTLLPHVADWRWGQSGSRTPWYPSMTLFRQPDPGNWDAVLQQIEQRLRNWASSDRA